MRMRQRKALVLLAISLVLAASAAHLQGCGTTRETQKIIQQDQEHAPENLAYFAQRNLEIVVDKMSKAVLDTTTPKEIADAIKRALPATVTISDGLVVARRDYIQRKADLAAITAAGEDAAAKRAELQDSLDAMLDAQKKAEEQRSAMVNQFGGHVSFNFDEADPGEPLAAMPFPFLLFLPSLFGTLSSLATQLAPKDGGGKTIAHYASLVAGLLTQGLSQGIDIKADLEELQREMQALVDAGRAATDEEMQASNDRLKASVAAALAHDTSGHPSLKQ